MMTVKATAIHSRQGWLRCTTPKGVLFSVPVTRSSLDDAWVRRDYGKLYPQGVLGGDHLTRDLTKRSNKKLAALADEMLAIQNRDHLIEAAVQAEDEERARLNEEANRERAAWVRRTLVDFLVREQANYQAAGQATVVDQLSEACALAQELGDDSLLRLDRIIHGLEG